MSSPASFCKVCAKPLDVGQSVGVKDGYDLLSCAHCGSITIHPFPSLDDLSAYYQAYKGKTDYRSKQAKKIRRSLRRIKRMMKLAPGKRFLDVGCNYGFAVMAALQLGLDAHGIDIDGVAINSNKEAVGEAHFSALSVEAFAEQGRTFDMVYSSEVIEHVPDPDSFVRSLSALLVKGGILYLTTPDAGHFRVPKRVETWKEVFPPEHIVYFTRQGIEHLFEKHGLRVRKFFFGLKPSLRVLAEKI